MNKRRVSRYKRRLQLAFWSHGDRNRRQGITQNVSLDGMFVSTSSPFRPGTRIFVEVPSGREKLVLQGEVRYAARVDPMLQRVKPSGMGVRFLRIEEVMADLLKLRHRGMEGVTELEREAVAEPPTNVKLTGRAFPMRFETPHELAKSYERDIKYGGLFVATPQPADEDDKVIIEFRFGWDPQRSVRVQAQVVKRFAAAEGSPAGDALIGMGVAFADPADVIRQFGNVMASVGKTAPPDS